MSPQNQFDIDPRAWNKFDLGLREAIVTMQAEPTLELPVIITLFPFDPVAASEAPLNREARRRHAQERQMAFERQASPLVENLQQLGAQDIQLLWINGTVSTRLTLPALKAVSQREEVKQIVLSVLQKVICQMTVV